MLQKPSKLNDKQKIEIELKFPNIVKSNGLTIKRFTRFEMEQHKFKNNSETPIYLDIESNP